MKVISLLRLPLFEDRIVTSSDLNRHSGEILRSATERPVTIARADGDLVLLQRTIAAELVHAASVWPETLRAFVFIVCLSVGERMDSEWVYALELSELVDLGQELAQAVHSPKASSGDLGEILALFHEWRESVHWTHDAGTLEAIDSAEEAFRSSGGVSLGPDNGNG